MYYLIGVLVFMWGVATIIVWSMDQGEYDKERTLVEIMRAQFDHVIMLLGKIW